MAKLFDEDGNEVQGGMTKEESDAAIKSASDAAIEEYKKANPAPEPKPETVVTPAGDEMPAWAKTLVDEVTGLRTERTTEIKATLASQYAGNDAEKRQQFIENFDRLTGYENTAEGRAAQAAAAATLAFGATPTVVVPGTAGPGRNAGGDGAGAAPTPEVVALRGALKITDEDVKKYGAQAEVINTPKI